MTKHKFGVFSYYNYVISCGVTISVKRHVNKQRTDAPKLLVISQAAKL